MATERLAGVDLSRGVDLSTGEAAKTSVRYNAENDITWVHHEIARQLYGWTDRFRDRFLDPIELPGKGKLPGPVLGFDTFDHRVLAYYHLGHNPHGLEDEIVLNETHLDRPLYSILETVLHEQLHLWQQRQGEHPVNRNYHNREFCERAEALGLHPVPVIGSHYKQADGAFEQLMREYGIAKPTEEVYPVGKDERRNWWDPPDKERRGKSTLSKWTCGCQNVRVGTKNLFAHCDICGNQFEPVIRSKAAQTVYEAPRKEGNGTRDRTSA